MTERPVIECDELHPSLFVPDVSVAAEYYVNKLGFTSGFMFGDPPTMAGVNLDRSRIFLEEGKPAPDGCSLYFVVSNADQLYEYHRANGVKIVVEPDDREYGLRDYRIRDLNGYDISFGHQTFTDGPPIEIERVDVPVRLEKRLAALLTDLAEFKRMTVSSCLEEILLHTNEPLGDGVASPHTALQLRYIRELKKKHGIDYDSHASYRFTETKV